MLEKSINFLSQLRDNNYKEWFHENKPFYDEAKKEFESFVNLLIKEIKSIDNEIGFPEPKDCIFRIFRDIRFSHDKTPYKTNFGAYIAKGGNRKSEYGGYYFHLEPGNSLFAGGIWMPQPDILKSIRNEIYNNANEFLAIVESKEFKKHFIGIDSDSVLKTAPKDFPKDWPYIAYLKFKSYTVSKSIPDELLLSPKILFSEANKVFGAMAPLNQFFNAVISDIRS
jgi:uncharacterized protein (TIGR02453 family)